MAKAVSDDYICDLINEKSIIIPMVFINSLSVWLETLIGIYVEGRVSDSYFI